MRILIVANETIEGTRLRRAIRSQAAGAAAEVLVVAPALNSRLRHWLSDEDEARRAAESRVRHYVAGLAAAGIHAGGVVGDADPLQALADALRVFPADELIISTQPEHRSHWLARDLVGRARARFGLPAVRIEETGHQAEVLSEAAGF